MNGTHSNITLYQQKPKLMEQIRHVLSSRYYSKSTERTYFLSVERYIYGSVFCLMECLRLRVKDIDFAMNEIIVQDAKGAKDRITILAESLKDRLRQHLKKVKLCMNET